MPYLSFYNAIIRYQLCSAQKHFRIVFYGWGFYSQFNFQNKKDDFALCSSMERICYFHVTDTVYSLCILAYYNKKIVAFQIYV